MAALAPAEIVALVERVFRPGPAERRVALLVDLPTPAHADRPDWKWRREEMLGWAAALGGAGYEATVYLYPAVGHTNGDLPARMHAHAGGALPAAPAGAGEALDELLARHPMVIAATEFSATAPLKVAARHIRFRGATMPGFAPAMVPALRLDYDEIGRRCDLLRRLLDEATAAEIDFVAAGAPHHLTLDLRFRTAHASSGLLREPGQVGNLPSGEAYIVPYEGERPGEPSRSQGEMPVEVDGELVVYVIAGNRAVAVTGKGAFAAREAALLAREPAYANLAELGLGVLADLGVTPIGELLLDEKLGLHIAFGRSDHFGGQVGPSRFSSPEAVIHLDRVFVRQIMPRVEVVCVALELPHRRAIIIEKDRFVLDFDSVRRLRE